MVSCAPVAEGVPLTSKRKGICCSKHPDAKLRVYCVSRVSIGVVIRYRRCTSKGCKFRCSTEERIRPYGGCRLKKPTT